MLVMGVDSPIDAPQRMMRSLPKSNWGFLVVWPISRLRRLLVRVREFNASTIELQQRRWLLNQPWREELLHWSFDGDHWHLHGHLVPPTDGRRGSVTDHGWCPGRPPTRPDE